MRRLELDFARRRPRWPAWALLVVGIAVAGDALVGYHGLRDEARELERQRSGARPAAPARREPLSEAMQRELDGARQVLHELALPWETLFRSIESALDNDTALLAIEPDALKRVVRISGEARDYPAVLEFMRRLAGAQVLAGVHLLNHQVRDDVAEHPVQFTLAASWRTQP
jgi:hypothetical protein